MPLQLQCTSVVIRNAALDKFLDGGAENFSSIAPNSASYGDDELSQASFMSPVDAEEFCKSLELRGLQRDSDEPDFVVVSQHDQSVVPACDWLVLFEWEERLIGTLRGSLSRTVIAPEKSHSDKIRHYSEEEIAEKFEFVSREDNVDTYRNKETGQLVYSARQTETTEEIFKAAFDTVWKNKREVGRPAITGQPAEEVKAAIEKLQKVYAAHPEAPRASLALGMAWYSIGNAANGIRSLRKAVEHGPEEPIYFKELAGVLLAESKFEEAAEIASRAVVLSPDDPELLGNLGVIELLNGQPERAKVTIDNALRFDPSDSINQMLQGVIADVISGARSAPKSLKELMKKPSKPKKKSFWSRLMGK